MKKYLLFYILFFVLVIGLGYSLTTHDDSTMTISKITSEPTNPVVGQVKSAVANMLPKKISQPISYVALGDSLTAGYAVPTEENFPTQLTQALKEKGINIELSANLAVSGYTSQQVLDNELPVFDGMTPNFVTLLVGGNDLLHQVDNATFGKNFSAIVDHVLTKLNNKNSLLILTIPDLALTPNGLKYGEHLPASSAIEVQNAIIKDIADQRGIKVIELYELSKAMGDDPTLIASDSFHPSGKEYAIWVNTIAPYAYDLMK
jgi:lysophospholipase L1-like esterase